MSLQSIAERIPEEYRKEILELSIIEKAQATSSSESMHYLSVIWKNYVEPDFKPDCNLCLARVLDNFKALKPTFIQMEKDNNLLNEL